MITLPRWIAHRGASQVAPENTRVAMRHAATLGGVCVEFDVTLSREGEPVVFHDDTLQRTTNGSGLIHQHSLSALKQLDAGSWFSPTFCGEQIPTLAEMLDELAQCGLGFNLELKPPPMRVEETVLAVLRVIKVHWSDTLPAPLYSSFSLPALRYLHQLAPEAHIGLLLHHYSPQWLTWADELACVSVHVNHTVLTKTWIDAIKATQRRVLSYTVNSLAQANALFAQGVDAVFADDITLATRSVDDTGSL